MSTLYRDYRPQNFSEVLGQNHVKIALQNEVAGGRPASAYLFCGPRAIGKTTVARILAKAVNCERRGAGAYEPCNDCASCRSITAGHNLEVSEIDAASNTGVDNVRENIIAFSRVAPTSAKFKVFIIDEVHMLSISAFNALLKIIEEPPAYVIFILCTTEVQKVPTTVVSRCERYDFKRISVKEIVKKLAYIASREKVEVDTAVLEAVARRSGGHLRDAESLLGQIFSLGDQKITSEQAELVIPHYNSHEAISLLDYLSKKDAAKAVELINNLAESGVNVKVFTNEIIGLLRRIMLDKLNPELADSLGLDLGESLEKRLLQVSANFNWEQLFSFTRRFLEAANDHKSQLIPQLPLELAVGELCFAPAPALVNPASEFNPPPNIPAKAANPGRPAASVTPSGTTRAKAKPLAADELAAKWPEFLVKIKKYNHSLSFVLQNCEPRANADGRLNLIFKYKFHRDRINDPNINSIVENTLTEVFGSGLVWESTIDESLALPRSEAAADQAGAPAPADNAAPAAPGTVAPPGGETTKGLMADLLKTFGGEIIS
ncbi:MAG: DNA polymerase III subunit gamma/tau [Patescibacteria group bacterium]